MLDGTIFPFFKPWALNMLLRWAQQDPISEKEIKRNEGIYGIQKNRNPFVDYPGLEQYIWGTATDVAFSYDNYAVPTSIFLVQKEVGEVTTPADNHLYNMKGQRVKFPRKGVYIHKARKVIAK